SATPPFTRTLPARMSSSQARRDATPARERYACSRTALLSIPVGPRKNDGKIFRARQIGQRPEAEVCEERGGRAIEKRPPERVRPADHVDDPSFLQGAQHPSRAYAPDLLDLCPPDWLPISDDRQRFERRRRQPGRHGHRMEPIEDGRELGS